MMDGKYLTLEDLNNDEAKKYVGGVVFVTVLMVIGCVGNLHVLLVYAFRIKPSNHRIFILFLCMVDLMACCIGMPFIIVDLRNPLTFTISSACKILRFLNYFVGTASSLLLVVIAIERYRKLCFPHGRQITEGVAKLLCVAVMCSALAISWPAPVLYGIADVQTSQPYVNGTRCSTENKENFEKYQIYFNAVLVLVVLVSFFVLVVLYLLIWRAISKHTRMKKLIGKTCVGAAAHHKRAEAYFKTMELSSYEIESPPSWRRTTSTPDVTREDSSDTNGTRGTESECHVSAISGHNNHEKTRHSHALKFDRAKRTTLIFLLITVVYFMSYVPHLALKITSFMKKDFFTSMSFASAVVYNTVIWCFFINNMANSFVYGFFDRRFRQEIKKIYIKLLCRQ